METVPSHLKINSCRLLKTVGCTLYNWIILSLLSTLTGDFRSPVHCKFQNTLTHIVTISL